jgi:hypothetical protein
MLQEEAIAGSLRIEVRSIELGSIRAADVELVRRAYFAVRDPAWGTIEPDILERELEQRGGGFALRARCRYTAEPIDLDAELEISSDDGELLRLSSTAVARSAFAYNRIGFCIHHPPAELAGATLVLGEDETFAVPTRVLPQLLVGDALAPAVGPFSRLTVTGTSGARVEFRFSGDEFELEDQRNWTDGAFKTYGTPLALGPPRPLTPGDRLTQSIEVRLLDAPRRHGFAPARIPALRLAAEATAPAIGFATGSAAADVELAGLAQPSHLRVDLRAGRAAVERTVRLAAELGSGVQLGLHLPLSDAERDDLLGVSFDDRLRSVLVLNHDVERLTGHEDAERVRALLDVDDSTTRLWTGTDAYYAQLNRALRAGLGMHLTFSMHPQAHASDEQSIVETLEIQRDVVLDLKAKQPGCRVSLGAVTFGLRRNFSAPRGVTVAEPAPDPRQSSLFGTTWSLASLAYLSEAGVDEVTYHTLAGPGGLVDADGVATPLLHLFADCAELGDQATLLESSAPDRCSALAFQSPTSLVILVGNLRNESYRVRLPVAGRGHIRRLHETSLSAATEQPLAFRDARDAWDGDSLELEPYEYVRLEVVK